MNDDDRWRLQHMLDAAREAVSFVRDETRDTLLSDARLIPALVMKITVIGEAASRVSDELRANHPEIAWADIVGMRNVLIHSYFKTDLDIVWDVVSNDLPQLIEQLESMIPPDSNAR